MAEENGSGWLRAARGAFGALISSLLVSAITTAFMLLATVPAMKAEFSAEVKSMSARIAEQEELARAIDSKLDAVTNALGASVARREEQIRSLEFSQRALENRMIMLEHEQREHEREDQALRRQR